MSKYNLATSRFRTTQDAPQTTLSGGDAYLKHARPERKHDLYRMRNDKPILLGHENTIARPNRLFTQRFKGKY